MRSIGVMVILLLSWNLLQADDTAMWEYPDGSSVIPMAEDRVQMVAETVDVKPINDSTVMVEARFTLKNLSAKPADITVGFPLINQWGGPDYYDQPMDTDKMREKLEFLSLVDGKSVATRIKPEKQEQTNYPGARQRYFFVWDVHFEPGQTKHLITKYKTQWARWFGVDGNRGYEFTYITKTGRAWAGNIEDALFTVRLPANVPRAGVFETRIASMWPMPKTGLIRAEDTLFVWHMRNWEPEKDIKLLVLEHSFLNSSGAAIMAEYILDHEVDPDTLCDKKTLRKFLNSYGMPLDVAAQHYINSVFALNGHIFSDTEKTKIFSWHDEYKPTKKLKLSDLPERHQKTIGLALEIKKDYLEQRQRVLSGPYGKYYADIEVLFIYPPEWRFEKGRFVDYIRDDDPGLWLWLVKNAFYAREGMRFKDRQLQEFFEIMPWYHYMAPEDFRGLSEDEQAIVDAIVAYMKEHGLGKP